MSKILLLNGSPHRNGCTATALEEMMRVFEAEGIEVTNGKVDLEKYQMQCPNTC